MANAKDLKLKSDVMTSVSSSSVEDTSLDLQKNQISDESRVKCSPTNMSAKNVAVVEQKTTSDVCTPESESDVPRSQRDNDEEESFEVCYNPFSSQSQMGINHVPYDSVLSNIGPFADNRLQSICNCDVVKKVTSNPDTRYLLSLLPDMSEMNAKQKEVFKSRVISSLNRVLEQIS